MRSVRSTLAQDLVGALQEQQLPVLLVGGQDDPVISSPDERTLAALGRNVYSFVFDGTQHYPMLDEVNKFSRLLRDFLTYRDDWGQIQIKDEWKRRMR